MTQDYLFNVIFDNKILTKALAVFQSIIEKKSSIMIFSSLKIKLDATEAILSGINIDIAAIKKCLAINLIADENSEASLSKYHNEIVINGHILYDIVKKITSSEIHIQQKIGENFITLTAGNSFFKIPLQENDIFPAIDLIQTHSKHFLNSKDLINLIENVLFCGAINDVRHFLCGIKIIKFSNKIEAVATDGHRMAWSMIENHQVDEHDTIEIIIPRKNALEILKQLKEVDNKQIEILLSKQKISFVLDEGRTVIISKLIDGNYPNYHQILNNTYDNIITIPVKSILESVERALILLDEKNSKAICFLMSNSNITITAESDSRGSIKEIIYNAKLDSKTNEQSISIMINAYYLYEIMRNIKTENVIISINDKKQPISFMEEGNINKFYLLMPMAF